jgi:Phage integrase, N-terminal SAM-like domain
VIGDGESRDLAVLVVPFVGGLVGTGNRYEPYRLVAADGMAVRAVSAYFQDLLAAGRAEATVRSYGMDLLRWFRFLWAAEVPWDRATRAEARDFSRWLQVTGKQPRPHWRSPAQATGVSGAVRGESCHRDRYTAGSG